MYGKELRNYLEELSHFRRIIEQIKGELLYAGLPLSEIFYNIASREKEPYENWLMDLAFQCQGTQEKRFADLWTDTIGKDLPELKWRGKMNPLICEPGELLEIGDREGVVRLLEYHLKRLDMEIEKRTAETSEKKKLGSWLGAELPLKSCAPAPAHDKKGGSVDPPFRVLMSAGRAGAARQDGDSWHGDASALPPSWRGDHPADGLLRRLPVPGI